jgi:hypothetical protein
VRARPVVQLRHVTALTSEEYVRQESWRQARLDGCPVHGPAECGLRRLGTYGRVEPAGMRVTRYYCAAAQTTFSLLPDCLAAQLRGSLDDLERVVAAVEAAPSVQAAADRLRPEIELPGAIRWVRRRLGPVRAVLLALVTLAPERFESCPPTLHDVGERIGRPVLRQVRAQASRHLGTLACPVGFGPRPRRGKRGRPRREHDPWADAPPHTE